MKVIFAFILGEKSGQFLYAGIGNYIRHFVWCTVHSVQSPYGCGVLFICVRAVQSLSPDKRIVSHFFYFLHMVHKLMKNRLYYAVVALVAAVALQSCHKVEEESVITGMWEYTSYSFSLQDKNGKEVVDIRQFFIERSKDVYGSFMTDDQIANLVDEYIKNLNSVPIAGYSRIQFKADGTVTGYAKNEKGDWEVGERSGTYKREGSKLTLSFNDAGMSFDGVYVILKLTATGLVLQVKNDYKEAFEAGRITMEQYQSYSMWYGDNIFIDTYTLKKIK